MTKTELVNAWFENLWNREIESTIDEILAPDIVAHGLDDSDVVGREQFRAFYRTFRDAFPTVVVTLVHVLEAGDHAICQASVQVTTADGRGPFTITGNCNVVVRDNQFVEAWNNFDFLTLLRHLGGVPHNAMASALAIAAVRS